MSRRTSRLIALAATGAITATLAHGQSESQSEQDQQGQADRQQQTQRQSQQQKERQQDSMRREAQQQGQQQGQWDPEAVMIIGYDLDRDGRTDAWYYVTQYEYERMRRDRDQAQGQPMRGQAFGRPAEQDRSFQGQQRYDQQSYGQDRSNQQRYDQQRFQQPRQMQRPQRQPTRDMGTDNRYAESFHEQYQYGDDRARRDYEQEMRRRDFERQRMAGQRRGNDPRMEQMNRPEQQMRQYSGKLTKLTTFSFADGRKHLVGKLETDEGQTYPVHFGLSSNLPTKIEQGDELTVMGHTGMLNGRRIILANRVQTDEGRYSIRPTSDQSYKQCSGTVVSTETLMLPNGGETVLAKVRKSDGSTEIVALGSQQHLESSNIELEQGKEIAILGRRVRIDGAPVVAASRIHANGRTVNVTPSPSEIREASNFRQVYSTLRSARQARAQQAEEANQ